MALSPGSGYGQTGFCDKKSLKKYFAGLMFGPDWDPNGERVFVQTSEEAEGQTGTGFR
jgi:hypothetical protein